MKIEVITNAEGKVYVPTWNDLSLQDKVDLVDFIDKQGLDPTTELYMQVNDFTIWLETLDKVAQQSEREIEELRKMREENSGS